MININYFHLTSLHEFYLHYKKIFSNIISLSFYLIVILLLVDVLLHKVVEAERVIEQRVSGDHQEVLLHIPVLCLEEACNFRRGSMSISFSISSRYFSFIQDFFLLLVKIFYFNVLPNMGIIFFSI